jgi:hypothetical protein
MLQWDHDQLLKEVQAAIAGVNKKPAKKLKDKYIVTQR